MFIILHCVNTFASGSVSVSKHNIELEKGDSTTFTISGDNVAGLVEIESSDSSVVTVDNDKYFFDTTLGEKDVTINVSAKKGGKAKIKVILSDVATFDEEELTGTEIIEVTVNDANGNNLDVKNIVITSVGFIILFGIAFVFGKNLIRKK